MQLDRLRVSSASGTRAGAPAHEPISGANRADPSLRLKKAHILHLSGSQTPAKWALFLPWLPL